jgi:quercetin dioxygenase-like cupin family protein
MIKRRSFLKNAAAIVPISGFSSIAFADPRQSRPSGQEDVVLAGKDRLGERHPRGYSSILFKVLPRDTSNGMFVIEHTKLVKGGPPLHMHPHQEEYFYVMEGEVQFQLGDKRAQLSAGDSILGPRGIPHTFAAVEGKPGRMLIAFTPAGKMEEFLRDTTIPNPPTEDASFWRKYDLELVGPSPFAG